ncbi:MAG: hypothetical protein KF778_00910 [Rhodocyclaceae bacterium]|nr:hypothetical protein [Rhodocyclaceae bacterium]MBX3666939.1 hypothetical protein [Rhodocyclaceae bacterium]
MRNPNRPSALANKSPPMTPKEQFQLARAIIEHENTLVGHRATWYLSFQAFLFAALFVAIGLFDKTKFAAGGLERKHLAVAVFLLLALGFVSGVVAYALVQAAYRQIDQVVEWWNSRGHSARSFPPITGTGGFSLFGRRISAAHFLLVLCAIWVAFIFIFASVAARVA